MHRDYTKICRVCMSEGSRDIFPKSLMDPSTTASGTAASSTSTSPLERLLEKLRYVTMMKIDENDDLPRLLCDLCIVQLNVAYNFKRQAVENDTKLRQYFIENGISSGHHHSVTNNNETTSIRSSFTGTQMPNHRNFPILPFIVKSEPTDIDGFSDATTETNVEILSTTPIDRLNLSNTTNNSSSTQIQGNRNNFCKEGSNSSMVYVNGYAANSVTPSSDIEFVQNFHTPLMNSSNLESPSNFKANTCFDSNPAVKETHNVDERVLHRFNSPKSHESQANKERIFNPADSKNNNRVKKSREVNKLVINMNFEPSSIPRSVKKKEKLAGKTTRVNDKIEKKHKLGNGIRSKKMGKTGPIESLPAKSENRLQSSARKSSMVMNPFTPKHTINENMKLLKSFRRKRVSEKVLRPKIDPPTTDNKLNISK